MLFRRKKKRSHYSLQDMGQEICEKYIQYKRQQKINNLIGESDNNIDSWLEQHSDIIVETTTIKGERRFKITIPI